LILSGVYLCASGNCKTPQSSMKIINFKVFSATLLAILLGIAAHFANPLTAAILLILWLASALFSLVAIVNGLFSKKFRFWYLIGFIPFLIGYTFENGVRNYKHKKAVNLTLQLEHYKMKTGRYPENLSKLSTKIQITGLTYSTNTDRTTYRIEYLMDQFDRAYFVSESKTWGTLGWND
jgi:hypothetical protein